MLSRLYSIAVAAALTLCPMAAGNFNLEIEREKAVSLRIHWSAPFQESIHCSATAVGPHSILTASHCEMPNDELQVNHEEAHVVATLRDGFDHSILLLSGIEFKVHATLAPREMVIGEQVSYFGNPDYFTGLYRVGTVVGKKQYFDPACFGEVIDSNTYFGDSGAGIFDNLGHLIGVINLVYGPISEDKSTPFKMTGALPVRFTAEQIARAGRF
jgi:Trypsin-like peptidase domain